MRYQFVTSMSRQGYEEYGRNFLDSYAEHVTHPLVVFSEDPLEDDRFPFRDLNQDEDLSKFLGSCPYPESPHYQWQAGKFARKIFAITAEMPYADWRIWIDADVVVEKPLDEPFMACACPDDFTGSYLGRKDWHTSECGFVAYNMAERGWDFLQEFRKLYTSGEIFDHLEWHDSYLFDRVRERRDDRWLNLSEGVPGMHVWDDCILGQYMKHFKGPLRKKGKSGDVPPEYWSEREREHERT